MADGFLTARDPVWAPDGQSLLFFGRKTADDSPSGRFDWWWAPLDGREPVPTGRTAYGRSGTLYWRRRLYGGGSGRSSARDLDARGRAVLGRTRRRHQHVAPGGISVYGGSGGSLTRATAQGPRDACGPSTSSTARRRNSWSARKRHRPGRYFARRPLALVRFAETCLGCARPAGRSTAGAEVGHRSQNVRGFGRTGVRLVAGRQTTLFAAGA